MEPSNVLSTLTVKELYRAFNTADSTAIGSVRAAEAGRRLVVKRAARCLPRPYEV
jgi:hypothetical protein